jgi:hypothetical protein
VAPNGATGKSADETARIVGLLAARLSAPARFSQTRGKGSGVDRGKTTNRAAQVQIIAGQRTGTEARTGRKLEHTNRDGGGGAPALPRLIVGLSFFQTIAAANLLAIMLARNKNGVSFFS